MKRRTFMKMASLFPFVPLKHEKSEELEAVNLSNWDGLALLAHWGSLYGKETYYNGNHPYHMCIGEDKTKIRIVGLERNNSAKYWRLPLRLQYENKKHLYNGERQSDGYTRITGGVFEDICEISIKSGQILFDCLWQLGFRHE